VNVSWFYPAVLAEGVVYFVFVVAVSGGVAADVGAEFEWVVAILWGEEIVRGAILGF